MRKDENQKGDGGEYLFFGVDVVVRLFSKRNLVNVRN